MPVYSPPNFSARFAKYAYYKILTKKDLRQYWLMTKEESVRVTIPDVDFRDFIHATLSYQPKEEPEEKMPELQPAEAEEVATPIAVMKTK